MKLIQLCQLMFNFDPQKYSLDSMFDDMDIIYNDVYKDVVGRNLWLHYMWINIVVIMQYNGDQKNKNKKTNIHSTQSLLMLMLMLMIWTVTGHQHL